MDKLNIQLINIGEEIQNKFSKFSLKNKIIDWDLDFIFKSSCNNSFISGKARQCKHKSLKINNTNYSANKNNDFILLIETKNKFENDKPVSCYFCNKNIFTFNECSITSNKKISHISCKFINDNFNNNDEIALGINKYLKQIKNYSNSNKLCFFCENYVHFYDLFIFKCCNGIISHNTCLFGSVYSQNDLRCPSCRIDNFITKTININGDISHN
jgi:hypothetical protein